MPYYPDEMGDKLEDKVFCYSIQWGIAGVIAPAALSAHG